MLFEIVYMYPATQPVLNPSSMPIYSVLEDGKTLYPHLGIRKAGAGANSWPNTQQSLRTWVFCASQGSWRFHSHLRKHP